MNVIVTCGPSYEPIDEVRRLTNFSTGRLGITLANALAEAGHRVFCLKGEQASDPTPLRVHKAMAFSTNDDLAAKLQQLAGENIGAVFHAAALCDFKIASVQNEGGTRIQSAKIPSRGQDNLTLKLVPATKLLPKMRGWFPGAKIVGWKYELVGSQAEAIAKAFAQLSEAHTDGCVVNGASYGAGFGWCAAPKTVAHLADLAQLVDFLIAFIQGPPRP